MIKQLLSIAILISACGESIAGEHDGHSAHTPAGYAPVTIDPARIAAIELETAPVEEGELRKTLRAIGVVALDETRSAHVHTKIRGWIESVSVDFVGKKIAAGDPLCAIYSQDVYSAELEYIALLDHAGAPLREAARRRLQLWDVPAVELERLERTREPRQTFSLLAPRAGVVVAKEATAGLFVDPSLELFTLSDLSRVWVLVDLYEADVPFVQRGDRARLTIEGAPEPRDAELAFLSPTIDAATRTVKARFELSNPAGAIRPGAFVSAAIEVSLGRGLSIPENAVIRTGTRSIVFVAHGAHFMPREVSLGPLAGGRYRIDGGLERGDRVATGAQFLLDSESRLKGSGGGGGHVH